MAVQFLTLEEYQLKHVDLTLSEDGQKILFKFDLIEKTILVLVFATNTLWLPIFMYQIWELNYLIFVIDEYDEFNTLQN